MFWRPYGYLGSAITPEESLGEAFSIIQSSTSAVQVTKTSLPAG